MPITGLSSNTERVPLYMVAIPQSWLSYMHITASPFQGCFSWKNRNKTLVEIPGKMEFASCFQSTIQKGKLPCACIVTLEGFQS